MKQALYIGKEPDFQKIVIASLALHIIFISLATMPLRSKDREYKSYSVSIVTPSEIHKPAAAPSVKKSVPAPEEKVRVKPPLKKRTRRIQKGPSLEPAERINREIERLQAINALEAKKKAQERAKEAEESIAQALDRIKKQKDQKENVSIGIGSVSRAASKDSESYHALIIRQIQKKWIHTEFDSPDLEAIISFTMDEKGNVVSHSIEKSSGSMIFDRTALKAILKASPLPPHPVEREIEVKFHL